MFTTQRLVTSSLYSFQLRFSSTIIAQYRDKKLFQIPMFDDNYSYLFVNYKTKTSFVVDPAEPSKILPLLKKENVKLTDILTTHHHWDHAGGNIELCKQFNHKINVFGGENKIQGLNCLVTEGNSIQFHDVTIEILNTPCHTSGHIVYYIPELPTPILFSGDTLFLGGCGRFFEGTPEQMVHAMTKLSKLKSDTLVCCGHEYSQSNLEFALIIEENNTDLKEKYKWVKNQREKQYSTVPSTIKEELQYNPFMRYHLNVVKDKIQTTDKSDINIMKILREMKNNS